MFSSCLFTDKSTIRSSWLLSHNMHMKLNSKHRNLFVILFVIVHVLSFELNLLAVTHLGRADFFPVVSILFNVDAERLSTPVTTQTTELLFKKKKKKKSLKMRMVSSSLLPAVTDWSCLMVAVGENVHAHNWSRQNKENLWVSWHAERPNFPSLNPNSCFCPHFKDISLTELTNSPCDA